MCRRPTSAWHSTAVDGRRLSGSHAARGGKGREGARLATRTLPGTLPPTTPGARYACCAELPGVWVTPLKGGASPRAPLPGLPDRGWCQIEARSVQAGAERSDRVVQVCCGLLGANAPKKGFCWLWHPTWHAATCTGRNRRGLARGAGVRTPVHDCSPPRSGARWGPRKAPAGRYRSTLHHRACFPRCLVPPRPRAAWWVPGRAAACLASIKAAYERCTPPEQQPSDPSKPRKQPSKRPPPADCGAAVGTAARQPHHLPPPPQPRGLQPSSA